MNYIENALNLSRSPPKPNQHATGTQADFLKALRILGTTFPDSPRLFDHRQQKRLDMQAVFLCCSRECREWVFGPPRNVAEHRSNQWGQSISDLGMPLCGWNGDVSGASLECGQQRAASRPCQNLSL